MDIYFWLMIGNLAWLSLTSGCERRVKNDINPTKKDVIILQYRAYLPAILVLLYSYKDGFNEITLISGLFSPYLLVKYDEHVKRILQNKGIEKNF